MYLNFVIIYVCSMSSNLPNFRILTNGEPILDYTSDAEIVRKTKSHQRMTRAKPPEIVHKEAVQALLRRNGDVENRAMVLGQYKLLFGAFQGNTFKWSLENGLGYSAYIVENMKKETRTVAPLSANKFALKVNIPETCS